MTNETLRMQMLSGIITEGQYKTKLQENLFRKLIDKILGVEEDEDEIEDLPRKSEYDDLTDEQAKEAYTELAKKANSLGDTHGDFDASAWVSGYSYAMNVLKDKYPHINFNAKNESLNESMIGGIVGIGAINQIPPRAKADYETAFEHFLGEKYGLNEVEIEEVKIEEGAFGDLLSKMENNTRMAADILTVITLAKEDKEGNAEKAVELLMKNSNLSEEAALEAVTRIFKKAFEWVDSREEEGKIKGIDEVEEKTYFPQGEFKSTENFEDFLKEIDAMPKESVRQIMGKHHYIPTPGTYQQQAKNYDNDIKLYMEDNIGKTDLYQLEEYWKFYISDEYRKK